MPNLTFKSRDTLVNKDARIASWLCSMIMTLSASVSPSNAHEDESIDEIVMLLMDLAAGQHELILACGHATPFCTKRDKKLAAPFTFLKERIWKRWVRIPCNDTSAGMPEVEPWIGMI